jgi:LysW-gamma-L-lysine carboxypeptidase
MDDPRAEDLLEELVRVPSPSGEERAVVELLVARMAALGFDAEIDAAGNAVGRIGTRGPRVCLLGHVDTVPGHVPVRREHGRLYGRGSVDAKGPLVAFVAAAARAAHDGTLAARVEIVACVEEEVPSSRGAWHRATLPAPDLCVVGEPSGWDGITLGYKGFLRARLEVSSKVAHTASDHAGAAALACRTYVALEEAAAAFAPPDAPLFDRLLLHLDDVCKAGDGLFDRAHLGLRLRLPPNLSPPEAEAWLRARTPGWELAAEPGLAAWSGPRTGPLARVLARAIAKAGGRPHNQRKTGTADLNVVAPAWDCPALAYGPGDSSLDHTPDEHNEHDELARGVAVITEHLRTPI